MNFIAKQNTSNILHTLPESLYFFDEDMLPDLKSYGSHTKMINSDTL